MSNIKKTFVLLVFSLFTLFFITGCSSDGNLMSPLLGGGTPENGNIVVSIKTQTGDINQVNVTSAKFLLKDIEFAENRGGCNSIAVGPVVANVLVNGGTSNVVVGNLPNGAYSEIRFKIHKMGHNDPISDPEFVEGPGGNQRFSVVVKGTFNEEPFVYKSRVTVNKVLQFQDPLIINEGSKFRIVMVISPQLWFLKNGDFLDPNKESNRYQIDKNIRDSFRWVYIEQ
ncbi:MAG: hypothetical protein EHM58_07220 [Ignavibacteriae bacterium]|nr:MAG: hypothetical protein EHM58_07220 [Ignavibacteriota bacterium]